MTSRSTRGATTWALWTWAAVASLVLRLLTPSGAEADFHVVQIDEVQAGRDGNPNVQFIEIVMQSFGQNCQATGNHGVPGDVVNPPCDLFGPGAEIAFFDESGTQVGTFIFPSNTPIGEFGRSLLVGTAEFRDQPDAPRPDFIMPPNIVADSGRVCYRNRASAPFFVNLCVTYGNFTGPPDFGDSTPSLLPITGNQSLRRTGGCCPTFALGAPEPRDNSGDEPGNQPPIANDLTVETREDTPVAIKLTGSDPEGATLTFLLLGQPELGTLSGTPPNLTYTPGPNVFGQDSFTFTVNDGTQDGNNARVTIDIRSVNDVPVANSQTVSTPEDTPISITLTASDDSGSVTFVIIAAPAHGTLTGAPPDLTYTPAPNFFGTDSFTFRVSDGQLMSNVATAAIMVGAVNDPPAFNAIADVIVLENSTTRGITITGVSPGASNEASQQVVVTATSSDPAIIPDPSVSGRGDTRVLAFTPVTSVIGTVTITVVADDRQGQNNTFSRTFRITVGLPATLTVVVEGGQGGTVSSSPTGIVLCNSRCSAVFPVVQTVTLTAPPLLTATFGGWSEPACGTAMTCQVTLDLEAPTTITARFLQTLVVRKSGDGVGTVMSTPSGIDCGPSCSLASATFIAGSRVTLAAAVGQGTVLGRWLGSPCGRATTCVVTMTRAKTVTAPFLARPDLLVQSLTIAETTVLPGGFLTATVVLQNQGLAAAGPSVTRFFLSLDDVRNAGDRLMTPTLPLSGLPAGESGVAQTVSLIVPRTIPPGRYFVLARADGLRRVAESDETNNWRASETAVVVAGPDLLMEGVTPQSGTVRVGGRLDVTATLRNVGLIASPASVTRYYLSMDATRSSDDRLLTGSRTFGPLQPDTSIVETAQVTVPLTVPPATYAVLACADDLRRAAESDETNNCGASETTVVVGAAGDTGQGPR